MIKSFESETETTFRYFKSNSPFFPLKSHDLCPDFKGNTSKNDSDSESETSVDWEARDRDGRLRETMVYILPSCMVGMSSVMPQMAELQEILCLKKIWSKL